MCLTSNFWNFFVQGLSNGFIYALIALGYTLVYGILQLINFAHSEVFMSGAFGSLFVLEKVVGSHSPSGIASVGLVGLGIVSGGVIGGTVAFGLERIAYRPLRRRNAPKLAYLISAIGASYFLLSFAGKEFGRDSVDIPTLFGNGVVFHLFGAAVQTYTVVVAGVAIVMLVFLDRLVARTRLGQGIRAVAQDADTASMMGIDINRVIAQTFIIGGVLGGIAGFLFAIPSGVIFTMGTVPGIKAFTAAVLGGIGNIRGAVIGGLLLGIVESLSTSCINASWTDVIAFVILVGVLLFRPTGILGERLGRSA
jgi:branched-chain amino acid transport system permease protein